MNTELGGQPFDVPTDSEGAVSGSGLPASLMRRLTTQCAKPFEAEIEAQEFARRVSSLLTLALGPDSTLDHSAGPRECPYCEGRGWNTIAVHDPTDPDGEPLPEQEQCAACGGAGTVSP